MRTVHVPASVPYDVEIGPGLLRGLGDKVRALCPKASRFLVVTDDTVGPLWLRKAIDPLFAGELPLVPYTLPHGEASKTAENLIALLNAAASEHFTRSDVFLALGGGMLDSSVGGKTAVDLPAGKNLMGAFWQPRAVVCDTDTLATLPQADFASGCAEMIKTAVLFDEELFSLLEREGPAFDRESVIARCVAHKRDVVARDERDTGERVLLNLGHTLGHAVEACSGFSLTHGQCVAIGMAVVSRAAARRGMCPPDVPERVCRALELFGLPTATDIPLPELMEKMLSDKKRGGDTISLIVPQRIGSCAVVPMDTQAVYDFMEAGL